MWGIDYRRAFSRVLKAVLNVNAVARTRQRVFAFAPVRDRERGQTLMEFALVIPVMLVFLLIVVDFGLAMDRRVVLQHAVREGARTGATGADVFEIQEITANNVGDPVTPSDIDVCYIDSDNNGQLGNVGDDVRVSADVAYHFTTGGTELFTAFGWEAEELSIPMKPSADMRLEQTVAGATACS